MKQPVKKLFDTPEKQLIDQGKKIYNTQGQELIHILSDNQEGTYDRLIVDTSLLSRITTGSSNITQLSSDSEEIIPVYAFFQKYARNIIALVKNTDIQNIDVSTQHRKEDFLNECNSKIFNQSVIKYLKYSMYEFYKKNQGMIQFKMPFIEIASAAGIVYFLDKYGIDTTLLNTTNQERKQRGEKKMKAGGIVFPIDKNGDPEEIGKKIINHINNRKAYENPN